MRRNKYKRDKYGHIKGENDVQDKNPFGTLERLEEEEQQEDEEEKKQEHEEGVTKISTKEWANKNFGDLNTKQKDSEPKETTEKVNEKRTFNDKVMEKGSEETSGHKQSEEKVIQ
ncbi:hypothetical protein KY285_008788 [Solanum tuberosum]|nr:hypothetical protein KY289_009279 [Solanum tuberosum]KAH0715841.1 hypothetical protein KY284_008746 [Solanum tuberosum]KAH0747131.1 hypothetical protein KY285_008788 [Solanum tuberosum]